MGRPNGVKDEFALVLREALKDAQGRVPSAAAIAREFNLRANGIEPVTQESVRRWLRGISMPEEQKMSILVSWLDLDLIKVMKCAHAVELGGRGLRAATANNQQPTNGANLPEIDEESLERARQIAGLSPADQQLLKDFLSRLVQQSTHVGHSAIKNWPKHEGH